VIEEVRASEGWANCFVGFRRPYRHPTADESGSLAGRSGLHVDGLHVQDKAWDFGSRDSFVAFCRATLVNWTGRLPEDRRGPFIVEVLDRYRPVAAKNPDEANTFRFSQTDVSLHRPTNPAPGASA
jgi:trans-aconitate 2-methyltransferase